MIVLDLVRRRVEPVSEMVIAVTAMIALSLIHISEPRDS